MYILKKTAAIIFEPTRSKEYIGQSRSIRSKFSLNARYDWSKSGFQRMPSDQHNSFREMELLIYTAVRSSYARHPASFGLYGKIVVQRKFSFTF